MTNREKFKETFGFKPNNTCAIAPFKICNQYEECLLDDTENNCPFYDWWNKEYLPCFVLAEEFEDEEV